MQKILKSKGWLILLLIFTVGCFFYFDLASYLNLQFLKANQLKLNELYLSNPILFTSSFLGIYILSTALSLPGATILTLAGGVFFGLGLGTLLVSIASTSGATLAFLVSRYILRSSIEQKFQTVFAKINEGIQKQGSFYLFTLRLVPIFPFFLINLLMGLTQMRIRSFFFVSQIGMLPGTLVYVNAGTQISQIESLKGLLSPELLLSFALIGVLPWISKLGLNYIQSRKHLKLFKKPKKFKYNAVVIGAGSAGLVSAYIAAAVKAKVALIEKHKMGGDCLNTGCVPSKAFIRSAKAFHQLKKSHHYGLPKTNPPDPVFAEIMDRVQTVIQKIEPHDSVKRYSDLGVECFSAEAKILSPYEVKIGEKVLTTKNIIIATGASPLVPNLPGLDKISFLTSDNVWSLRIQPKKLIILGGGPIGCELAQSFARLGTEVLLVEKAPRLMFREDPEVSDYIQNTFRKENIQVYLSHTALRIENKTLICTHNNNEVRLEFEQILIALGRKANIKGFGLENLNIEISDRGTILANEYLQTTNYPNIFACGDVTGPYQFTHTAAHQAWYVAVNALFGKIKKFKVDYSVIPWCTFTDPEVARVGLNETEAQEKNISYQVSRYDLDDLDRAIADNNDHGFVKVLTSPGTDRILGVTIVGEHAGDIIAEYVTAMKYNLGLNKILGTIHIYPTYAEANKFAAGVWKKTNAPQQLLYWVEKFHNWSRS